MYFTVSMASRTLKAAAGCCWMLDFCWDEIIGTNPPSPRCEVVDESTLFLGFSERKASLVHPINIINMIDQAISNHLTSQTDTQ